MKVRHTCYGDIPKERLERIANYKTSDITSGRFADPAKFRELKDVMAYHPSPITRHEACFVAAELQVPVAHLLVSIVKFDKSIVAKHEAAESLGKVRDEDDAWMAYSFLRRAQSSGFDEEVYHPDVQSTIQESIAELEERFPDFIKRTR